MTPLIHSILAVPLLASLAFPQAADKGNSAQSFRQPTRIEMMQAWSREKVEITVKPVSSMICSERGDSLSTEAYELRVWPAAYCYHEVELLSDRTEMSYEIPPKIFSLKTKRITLASTEPTTLTIRVRDLMPAIHPRLFEYYNETMAELEEECGFDERLEIGFHVQIQTVESQIDVGNTFFILDELSDPEWTISFDDIFSDVKFVVEAHKR